MLLEIACTMSARLRGLFGRAGFDGVLLLVPCHDVHTFGMQRPIDVAFVASDGVVVESRRRVAPGQRLRNQEAVATLERFASDGPWFAPGDSLLRDVPPQQAQRKDSDHEKMPDMPVVDV